MVHEPKMDTKLSTSQSKALFDILTHWDTYAEIRNFRDPSSLKHYGPPFTSEDKKPSTAPALQSLVSKFLLTLPGLKDLSDDFWKVQCHDIIQNFEESNLSESYDKGFIGSRKTLATAISALIEYPVRGVYGGFAEINDNEQNYNVSKAEDLSRSFRDFVNGCVYGTILEETVMKASETDKLEDHSVIIKAVHEFVLVNLASFMHYTLILSPKGQYLLKLIENANKLIPYMVIKQTLKIGNVASMINGMMKVVLAKMSVSTITNWIGLTQGHDEGTNLMQYIISTVLNWDIKDLESRGTKLEKQRAKLGKEQFHALREYSTKSREEQEKIRKDSQHNSISIVTAILKTTDLEYHLTDVHHKEALDYLGIQLSIRDRKEIIQTLCRSTPDHLTESVRELVSAYDPVIRQAHNAIDLSGTISDLEYFLKDMIKLAKIQPSKDTNNNSKTAIPTVGDFIQLLRKHQYASHTFIHQCCKNGPELTGWYIDWVKKVSSQFKIDNNSSSNSKELKGAGNLTQPLQDLFESLPHELKREILPELDLYNKYLKEMQLASQNRLQSVLNTPPSKNPHIIKIFSSTSSNLSRPSSRPSSRAQSPAPKNHDDDDDKTTTTTTEPIKISSSDAGPGAYLSRWQDLLDRTPITPLNQKGKILHANDTEIIEKSAVDVDGNQVLQFDSKNPGQGVDMDISGQGGRGKNKKPNIDIVVDALGGKFRDLLAQKSCYW